MKTSTIHSNGKKGWPARVLAGLVFTALVLTGCPQPSSGGNTGGSDNNATPTTPPLAVTNLSAVYDATKKTVTVSWNKPAGTTAHKYKVTLGSTAKESYSTDCTFTGIEATEKEETVTVEGVAKDGTTGAKATTTVKLTAELAVADIELNAAVLAPEASCNVTVTFTNGGKIQDTDTLQLQLYKGETKEGEAVKLTKNSWNEDYSAYLSAPATVGTYTLKVLRNNTEVPGQTATLTVQEPKIDSIILNRTEVRPGSTIIGELEGNEALASLSGLRATVTAEDGKEVGTIYSISKLKFTYAVPSGTPDGTYTITVIQSSWNQETQPSTTTTLGTVEFTVKADAPLPSMDNPFADGNSYITTSSYQPITWKVQGSHLITTETSYDNTTKENWYTFSHDAANNRITLTPYKLYERDSDKTLTKAEYEKALRESQTYSEDALRARYREKIADKKEKEKIIAEIKAADSTVTGLESMTDDQFLDTYFRVILKSMGYNNWNEYVTAMITQDLNDFDVKTTYSYVADSSTGSLEATERWDPSATFKTLYDAGTDFRFSYSNSSTGETAGTITDISFYGTDVSLSIGKDSSTYYTIESVTDSAITLKAYSGGTATMTFGPITDKEPAYEGESPQKQMTVTYNGQSYTLTHRLTRHSFTIQ
ncbi:MAG: hypothetical protein IKA80_10850 [Spirochaetaceae bacterium]|nr:hypothetical protein [Spirochaetaceae bacterium]